MVTRSKYSEKFFEIEFSNKVSKKAYLNACKWLAVKVYGNEELSRYVSVQIVKQKERKLPTFTVSLYITVEEKDLKIEYCNKCKSLHSLMSVGPPDCNTCKMQGYRNYLNSNTKNLVEFWREVFTNEEEI